MIYNQSSIANLSLILLWLVSVATSIKGVLYSVKENTWKEVPQHGASRTICNQNITFL